jgi:FRG domain
MVVEQQAFFAETIKSWDKLIESIGQLSNPRCPQWLYRGQAHDWCLKSTLERSIEDWGFDLKDAPELEEALAREFRRRVRGEEQSFVQEDMLNCLALMQHHGAPTRLLDCGYSPFVAAQAALKEGLNPDHEPVIWCFNPYWMEEYCDRFLGRVRNDLERKRRVDILFNRKPPHLLVMPETPYFLNERLTAHQGAFLCTGDISKPFVKNLKAMIGWNSGDNVRKLRLCFDREERVKAVKTLKRMNVSSTVLFQG